MKKIIVSIIVIGLLLSTVPLSMGINEVVEENISELGGQISINSSHDSSLFSEYVSGELIVKFKDDVSVNMSVSTNGASTTGATSIGSPERTTLIDDVAPVEVLTTGIESIDSLNMQYGVYSEEKLIEDESVPSLLNTHILKLPEDSDILLIAEEYKEDPNVEFAEPNYIFRQEVLVEEHQQLDLECSSRKSSSFFPNDPYFADQWALHNTGQNGGTPDADIDAPEAWETTMGDEDVVIAILDTGIDYTHPDLGNCTDGIVEEDFFFESPHPIKGYYTTTLNFSGCDKIALHFSKIDIEDDESSDSSIMYISIGEENKIGRLIDYYINENMTDVWTAYTELGVTSVKIEVFTNDTECWGFAIDKVRKVNWIKLSVQCPEKYVDGYDFGHNDPDPADCLGHGTACAGIASAVANNNIGIAGVAGNCKIMPIRVVDNAEIIGHPFLNIAFSYLVFGANCIRGIVYAANHGADVLSMSIGWPVYPSIFVKLAVDYAYEKGCVLVAAAGNANLPIKIYPAGYKNVIAVAGTDNNDTKVVYSSYGHWVDIAAPTGVYCTTPTYHNLFAAGGLPLYYYAYSGGTSSSCPHVAGVAALILSRAKELGLELTPDDVKTILCSSTDPVNSDKPIGSGRVNAFKALQMLENYDPDDPPDNQEYQSQQSSQQQQIIVPQQMKLLRGFLSNN